MTNFEYISTNKKALAKLLIKQDRAIVTNTASPDIYYQDYLITPDNQRFTSQISTNDFLYKNNIVTAPMPQDWKNAIQHTINWLDSNKVAWVNDNDILDNNKK